MSDDSRTHFKFDRDGIHIELTGDRRFVEKMYRRIMRDLEAVRAEVDPDPADEASAAPARQSADAPDPTPPREPSDQIVWVMRVSDMMRRIYMADLKDFTDSPLADALRPENITTLYIDKSAMADLLGDVHRRRDTLWAELTATGRERLGDRRD